ncbi:MAG: hypothetical protein WCT39_03875, partial [Candidatus Margulisiibacteriota bacterium]
MNIEDLTKKGRNNMNINKYVRILSVTIFVLYFVSMVVGPSYGQESLVGDGSKHEVESELYGWKGTATGIEYEIHVFTLFNVYEVLTRGSTEDIRIVCQNNGEPVNELNISLPDGFELVEKYEAKKPWPWLKNWTHSFKIKTPQQAGIYQIAFTGKDIKSRDITFEVPITVVD